MDLKLRMAQTVVELAHAGQRIASRCFGQICQGLVVEVHVAMAAFVVMVQKCGDDIDQTSVEPDKNLGKSCMCDCCR